MLAMAIALTSNLATAGEAADSDSIEALSQMSLAELAQVQVTSVSKISQAANTAPATLYVITHEQISRSGARSLPEVLRLAPNLQVSQRSASDYAVSARGFGGNVPDQNFSNKILILIDGRSVYSPLFSGIFFQQIDVLLEDIERIEVISGPGATLWGANAMNGVINIITRSTTQTEGALLEGNGGNQDANGAARYGGHITQDATYRVYAFGFDRDALEQADGSSAHDRWTKAQAGFRTDWEHGPDLMTVQGDVYHGNQAQVMASEFGLSGTNLLGRWQHATSGSQWQVQAYIDHAEAGVPVNGAGFVLNTYDVELQQSLAAGPLGTWVWGAGERLSDYHIANSPTLLYVPSHRWLDLTNLFAQGTFALSPQVNLITGLKVEKDPYSDWSPMPDVRLSWMPLQNTTFWAAASRAVRSPTPLDEDVQEKVGTTVFLTGNSGFRTEKVIAYELGYRTQVSTWLSVSAATYYNVYRDLRTIEPDSSTVFVPLHWGNLMAGQTYGTEAWADVQITSWWRLSPGLRTFHERLHFEPGASRLLGVSQAGDDPTASASLKSSMTFSPAMTFDADLRHTDTFPDPAVRAYYELDLRLGWRVSGSWELSVNGNNLLHARHQEYEGGEYIPRGVMVGARWEP